MEYGEWERENGYRNTESLVKKGVTAIFAMNDFIAGGAYDRLRELGRKVGKDIAVVGYENPPLTTMGLPLHDIGYCASEIILKLLRKEELTVENGVYYVECNPFFRASVNELQP